MVEIWKKDLKLEIGFKCIATAVKMLFLCCFLIKKYKKNVVRIFNIKITNNQNPQPAGMFLPKRKKNKINKILKKLKKKILF